MTEGTWTCMIFFLFISMQIIACSVMIVMLNILYKRDQNKANQEKVKTERWNARLENIEQRIL